MKRLKRGHGRLAERRVSIAAGQRIPAPKLPASGLEAGGESAAGGWPRPAEPSCGGWPLEAGRGGLAGGLCGVRGGPSATGAREAPPWRT